MSKQFNELLNLIKNHEKIVIMRHHMPDGDALGSQFGIGNWIKINFPKKKIYYIGYDSEDRLSKLFPKANNVSEKNQDKLKDSLVIVTDCANAKRIDNHNFDYQKFAKTIVKIDHHVKGEEYGDFNLVDENASSACQIVTLFIKHHFPKYKTDQKTMTFLYVGLVTDSGRFMFPSTSSQTFEAAIFLIENQANRSAVHKVLYTLPRNEIRLINHLQQNFSTLPGGVAYFILKPEIIKSMNLNFATAKNFVNTLGVFEDCHFWSLITYDDIDNVWRVSLRSREKTINQIAIKYGGGGHKLACATKVETLNNVMDILNDLSDFAQQQN